MNNEKMYHIGLKKDDIKNVKYAIVTGDSERIEIIKKFFGNIIDLGVSREYKSIIGTYNDKNILIMSTGIGSPSMAIAVEELAQLGIKYVIRVGTCGGMNQDVNPGDLVIAQAAIRQEGTTKEYIPLEYPAVADIDLTIALSVSAKRLGYKYHTGVVQTKDSFYGQHNPESMPIGNELTSKWNSWIKGNCLASEMESSALFIVSKIRNVKSGCILLCVWNQEKENISIEGNHNFDMEKPFQVALNAFDLISK